MRALRRRPVDLRREAATRSACHRHRGGRGLRCWGRQVPVRGQRPLRAVRLLTAPDGSTARPLANRGDRGGRTVDQLVGHPPQPRQRAQLHGDTEVVLRPVGCAQPRQVVVGEREDGAWSSGTDPDAAPDTGRPLADRSSAATIGGGRHHPGGTGWLLRIVTAVVSGHRSWSLRGRSSWTAPELSAWPCGRSGCVWKSWCHG